MSDSISVAWRRILLHLSGKLKPGESKNIAFMYDLPDRFRRCDVAGEDVLEHLEMKGEFSPLSPDGLVRVFANLERKDLVKLAKEKIGEFEAKHGRGVDSPLIEKCQCGRLQVACRSASFHVSSAEEHLSKIVAARNFQYDKALKRNISDADQLIQVLKTVLQKISDKIIVEEDATYDSLSELISPNNSPVHRNRPLPSAPVHPTTPQPFKELNASSPQSSRLGSKPPIPVTHSDGTSTGSNTPSVFFHPQEEKGEVPRVEEESDEEEEEPLYEHVEIVLSDSKNQQLFSRTSCARLPIKRAVYKSSASLDLQQGEDQEQIQDTMKDDSSEKFEGSGEYVTLKAIVPDSSRSANSTEDCIS